MPKGNAYKTATLQSNLIDNGNTFLALFSTNPGADGSGTEVVYDGYERKAITWGTPAINGSVGEIKNTTLIEFTVVPTSTGVIAAYAAVMSAQTVGQGNVIYYGALGANYPLIQGVKPTLPIASLTVTET